MFVVSRNLFWGMTLDKGISENKKNNNIIVDSLLRAYKRRFRSMAIQEVAKKNASFKRELRENRTYEELPSSEGDSSSLGKSLAKVLFGLGSGSKLFPDGKVSKKLR